MFRYKKNIQENDLPRKRVRKASKIAGSGGQYLEIRYPERGRKSQWIYSNNIKFPIFGNKIPREGTEILLEYHCKNSLNLFGNKIPREGTEIKRTFCYGNSFKAFGNKIPREGTEIIHVSSTFQIYYTNLEIRYPERGQK